MEGVAFSPSLINGCTFHIIMSGMNFIIMHPTFTLFRNLVYQTRKAALAKSSKLPAVYRALYSDVGGKVRTTAKNVSIHTGCGSNTVKMYVACVRGDLSGVKRCIEIQQIDPNAPLLTDVGTGTPLHVAARFGHLEIVKYLACLDSSTLCL